MREAFRFTGDLASPTKIKAALAWVRQGAKVIALHGIDTRGVCTCGSRECQSPGKHPIAGLFPKGQHSATKNRRKIRQAFEERPDANLGVILPPGLVALDVDGAEGVKTFEKLKLPRTLSVQTGRGKHHYFWAREALPEKKVRFDGMDIKDGDSGYIVVPPSTHHSGKKYRWTRTNRPTAALPDTFLQTLSKTDASTRRSQNMDTIRKGARNTELTSIAGSLRFRGLSETAIESALAAINDTCCEPPLNDDEVNRIAVSVAQYEAGNESAFDWLDNVEASEPEFLLYPYIVKGGITVLDGNMGTGKSTFTCAIAAAVTTGKPPPFAESIQCGSVLIMSAEDDPSRVLKPRLLQAGADVKKVRYQEELFSLDERGLTILRAELSSNTPELVIIDPIIAFMEARADSNKATEMTHFMVKIDQLAREFDTSIVIVRHLRKNKADNAMHQGIGSVAISARVRSGLTLAPYPDDPKGKRAVAHSKSNYAPPGQTLVFSIVSSSGSSHAHVEWHAPDPDISAEDLLNQSDGERGRPPKEREFASEWLVGQLRDGPKLKKDLDRLAEKMSISPATLRRVAAGLNVRKTRKGKQSAWSLP